MFTVGRHSNSGQYGGAMLYAVVIVGLLTVAMAMAHSLIGTTKKLAAKNMEPTEEIMFYARGNISCSETESQNSACVSGDIIQGWNKKLEVYIATPSQVFSDLNSGKTYHYRLICQTSKRFRVEMKFPDSASWRRAGEIVCP